MATSGTYTFVRTRDQIIKGALRLVGGYDPENASGPSATQVTDAAESLEMMIKFWQSQGLHLWTKRYAVIFPQKSQGLFILGAAAGAAGGDHATLNNTLGLGGFFQTTLASSAASGATTIVVSAYQGVDTAGVSGVDITNAYNIGIELDDGTVQWTTVNGAVSSTTITLAVALTGAAAAGNLVYVYQKKLSRPLRVTDAFIRNAVGGDDRPVNIISKEQYMRLGSKASIGAPTQLCFEPQRDTMNVFIYPEFSDAEQLLFLELQYSLEDAGASTDNPDFPVEWLAALKFNLALHLAPEYEVSQTKFKQILDLAGATLAGVTGWDQETASVFIQPHNNSWR
jgi:hypothetical protein